MDFRAGLGNFEYPGPPPSRYEEEWPVMGKLGGTADSNIIRPFQGRHDVFLCLKEEFL